MSLMDVLVESTRSVHGNIPADEGEELKTDLVALLTRVQERAYMDGSLQEDAAQASRLLAQLDDAYDPDHDALINHEVMDGNPSPYDEEDDVEVEHDPDETCDRCGRWEANQQMVLIRITEGGITKPDQGWCLDCAKKEGYLP